MKYHMINKKRQEGEILELKDWLTSQLSIDLFEKKYRHDNETFDEWLNRVTNYDDKIKQLILDKKFIYGGY